MEPAFADGDHVLVESIGESSVLEPGAVVVARHPFKQLDLVKYVASIDGDLVELHSPSGDDSRQFGRTHRRHVRGIVRSSLSQRRVVQ